MEEEAILYRRVSFKTSMSNNVLGKEKARQKRKVERGIMKGREEGQGMGWDGMSLYLNDKGDVRWQPKRKKNIGDVST